MRKLLCCSAALILAGVLSGCATAMAPVTGFVYTDLEAGGAVTSNTGSSKVGTASVTSILGAIATGDASVKAAAANGAITKIHHVDYHAESVLGLWAKYTTIVYGE